MHQLTIDRLLRCSILHRLHTYPKQWGCIRTSKMENKISIYEIIERARKERSIALGNLIASGTRKTVLWLLNQGNRFLHALLMSPVKTR